MSATNCCLLLLSISLAHTRLGALSLLAAATIGVCFVFGIKYHAEHIVMAIAIVLLLVHFLLLIRMVVKDILLERMPVYIAACCLLAACIAGLIYSARWIPVTCNGFYDAALGSCLGVTDTEVWASNPCLYVTSTGKNNYNLQELSPGFNGTELSCSDLTNIVMQCYNQQLNCSIPPANKA